MIGVWLLGLVLSVQYIYPLLMAISIIRKNQIQEQKEEITRLFIFFMIQAVWNLFEFYLNPYL
jgi:hypothetical protein